MADRYFADLTFGRTYWQMLYDRLTCTYPLTPCERLKYPYFCILIIRSTNISFTAKREFIKQFVIPYVNDRNFRVYCSYLIVFTKDHYIGNMEYDELRKYHKEYIRKNKLSKDLTLNQTFILMYNNFHPNCPYSLREEIYK